MKDLALFVIIISSLECSLAQEPSVYVQVTWDMEWHRLCNFIDFFAKKLAKELFETKVLYPYDVKPSRIRFMNAKSNCQDKESEEDAILKFFVSKSAKQDLGVGDVDRNITILAYRRLYDYWKNKKMALLDPIFIGKVDKVEILGKDKPLISEGMSESTRVGIGIAIGLIVVFLIAGISFCVNLKRKIKTERPHGVPVTNIPLRVTHTEPSEPTITTVDHEPPPAYDFHPRDELDSQDKSDRTNGFDRRNEFDRRNGFERQEESYNGKTAHNMAYDDEYLGSPML